MNIQSTAAQNFDFSPIENRFPDVIHALLDSRNGDGLQSGAPVSVTYHESDSSVYFDKQYVTRAVPGRILWHLLNQLKYQGRNDFRNLELRRAPELKLPELRDNLETRLQLLRNRLNDKFPFVRMYRTGRGCFRFEVDCELKFTTD
jgi:adenylate cyclase